MEDNFHMNKRAREERAIINFNEERGHSFSTCMNILPKEKEKNM